MKHQEELIVSTPRLAGQNLSVRLPVVGWPKLLKGGVELIDEKRQYTVPDDNGKETVISFKNHIFDPVPQLVVDKEIVNIVPRLKWYEYVWTGWPLVAGAFWGGMVGATLGYLALRYSCRLFRSDKNIFTKYLLSGFMGFGAVITCLITGTLLNIMMRGHL